MRRLAFIILIIPFILIAADESVIVNKSMAAYKQRCAKVTEKHRLSLSKLDLAYKGVSIKLADRQKTTLEAIKNRYTRMGDYNGAIAAKRQIEFLDKVIKGKEATLESEIDNATVNKSMETYFKACTVYQEKYKSKKLTIFTAMNKEVSILCQKQIAALEKFKKSSMSKGRLEDAMAALKQAKELNTNLADLLNTDIDIDAIVIAKADIVAKTDKEPVHDTAKIKYKFDASKLPKNVDIIVHNGHHYALIKESVTWKAAKAIASSYGGYLVCITTSNENDRVMSMTKGRVWFGATDEVKEGEWKWLSGEKFDYTNWDDNEPNNDGKDEHYLSKIRNVWWDEPGFRELFFIIEWDN